ncbi:hypothetical protein DFJ73DRAFT_798001 [Zopfochytrium polystomum]|nr:hypothetical protein DFJ73DRAFT_798001 [Zopfochytrium polystomum]
MLVWSVALFWWTRVYVSAICVDIKLVFVHRLLDSLFVASWASATMALVWTFARWPPDAHRTTLVEFAYIHAAVAPLWIPCMALAVYAPGDGAWKNLRNIIKNWAIGIVLLPASAVLVAFAFEMANARNRSTETNSALFTPEWFLSMAYLGLLFPIAKNMLLWITQLTPAWKDVGAECNLGDEVVRAHVLLKRVQYILVYECFFGIAGKVIVLRMETIQGFGSTLFRASTLPAAPSASRGKPAWPKSRPPPAAADVACNGSAAGQVYVVVTDADDANPDARMESDHTITAADSAASLTPTSPPPPEPLPLAAALDSPTKPPTPFPPPAPSSESTLDLDHLSPPPAAAAPRRKPTFTAVNAVLSVFMASPVFHRPVTDSAALPPELSHAWCTAFPLVALNVVAADWARCNGSLALTDLVARFAVTMAAAAVVETAVVAFETGRLGIDLVEVADALEIIEFGGKSFVPLVVGIGSKMDEA